MKSAYVITGTLNPLTTPGDNYSVAEYNMHPDRPFWKCFWKSKTQRHDLASLKTKQNIAFSRNVLPIGIKFDAIQGYVSARKHGYGCDEWEHKGFLNYIIVNATICPIRFSEKICAYKGYATDCEGDIGGPLVICPHGLTRNCVQIGVFVKYLNGYDSYISTRVEDQFINKTLRDIGFFPLHMQKKKLRSIAVQERVVSNLFVFSVPFFIIIFVLP